MMEALIQMTDKQGLPVYLETQTEGNVVFYKKFGFEVIKEVNLPNFDVKMW